MRVISYSRFAQSAIHIHASSSATCFYVPDLKCIIGTEQNGTFGGSTNFVTRDPEMLKEGAEIEKVTIPGGGIKFHDGGVQVSNVRVLYLEDAYIKEAVSSLDTLAVARVRSEELLSQLRSYVEKS